MIYAAYQFAIPYIMLGSNPGPDADLMMTLIYRQSFSNNLFGFGAAASDAAHARDVRVGGDLVSRVQAGPGGHMSARLVNRGLDALTWLVLVLMLSPIIWLVVCSLQTDGQLSTGAYNLLHPTLHGVQPDVADGRLRALPDQLADHLHGRRAGGDGVRVAAPATRSRASVPRRDRAVAGRGRAPS